MESARSLPGRLDRPIGSITPKRARRPVFGSRCRLPARLATFAPDVWEWHPLQISVWVAHSYRHRPDRMAADGRGATGRAGPTGRAGVDPPGPASAAPDVTAQRSSI